MPTPLSPNNITIVPATPADARAVSLFCQPVYVATYPNAKYGLMPEHFRYDIFDHPLTIEYFGKVMANHDNQRAYLAKLNSQIVGCISIERLEYFYELHAFYVSLDHQGQGVGKRLLHKALDFYRGDVPIRVEVGETNVKAIAMYKHWGFREAPEYGLHLRHWPEWPDGLQNGYIYMQATKGTLNV